MFHVRACSRVLAVPSWVEQSLPRLPRCAPDPTRPSACFARCACCAVCMPTALSIMAHIMEKIGLGGAVPGRIGERAAPAVPAAPCHAGGKTLASQMPEQLHFLLSVRRHPVSPGMVHLHSAAFKWTSTSLSTLTKPRCGCATAGLWLVDGALGIVAGTAALLALGTLTPYVVAGLGK